MKTEQGELSASGKRAGYGFLANLVALSINTLERLITVAILVRLWGAEIFGDWLILVAAAGLISLADLGTQAYFGNAYQAACARGDVSRFQRLLKVAMACRFAVAGLAAVVVLAAILVLDVRGVFGLSALSDREGAVVFALVALDALLQFPRDCLSQIYRAKGEYARSVLLSALVVVGKIGVVGSAVVFASSPTAVATWLVFTNVILGWGVMLADLRRFPDVTLGFSFPNRGEISEIVGTSKWYALSSAAVQLSLHVPVLVIGAWVGGGAIVVSLAASRTLVNLARQVPTYLALSSSVELAHLYYSGAKQPLAALFTATGRACCAFSGLLSGVVLGFGQPMVALWTGDPSLYSRGLLIILVLPLLLTAPALPARMLVYCGNHAREEGLGAGLQLLLLLPLAPGFTAAWGVLGTAVALALAEGIAIGIYLLRAGARVAGAGLADYLRRCLPLLAISFALSWGAAVLVEGAIDTNGLAGFLLAAGIWAVFVPGPVLVYALPAVVRQRLVQAVSKRLMRRRGNP